MQFKHRLQRLEQQHMSALRREKNQGVRKIVRAFLVDPPAREACWEYADSAFDYGPRHARTLVILERHRPVLEAAFPKDRAAHPKDWEACPPPAPGER